MSVVGMDDQDEDDQDDEGSSGEDGMELGGNFHLKRDDDDQVSFQTILPF